MNKELQELEGIKDRMRSYLSFRISINYKSYENKTSWTVEDLEAGIITIEEYIKNSNEA